MFFESSESKYASTLFTSSTTKKVEDTPSSTTKSTISLTYKIDDSSNTKDNSVAKLFNWISEHLMNDCPIRISELIILIP